MIDHSRRRIFQSSLVCLFGSLVTASSPLFAQPANSDLKLAQSRALFENDLCSLRKIYRDEKSPTISLPDEVTIRVQWDCKIVEAPGEMGRGKKQRIREEASAHYDLACSRKESKF